MILKIEQDFQRFRQIVRGKIREDLRRFMSSGELLGKQGKKYISIPLPQIDIPHFRYNTKQQGGIASGGGDVGTPLSPADAEGTQKAGDLPGEHVLEVDVSFEELAELLQEELELPNIKPRGGAEIVSAKNIYRGIRSLGPESLRHTKRTYKQALKRQLMTGNYNPENPVIIPYREDRRYRSFKELKIPQSRAIILYMMDVSGSMGGQQKELVRLESFWIDTWLRSQYKGVESRYIIHDATAKEVDRETFFHTRESGGTIISSAYKLCLELVDRYYDPNEWNIYPFHFSDGDNWSGSDTQTCMRLLKEEILPRVNQFSYGQVESEYGSGQFLNDLLENFDPSDENVRLITSRVVSKDKILDSIKDFFKKGR